MTKRNEIFDNIMAYISVDVMGVQIGFDSAQDALSAIALPDNLSQSIPLVLLLSAWVILVIFLRYSAAPSRIVFLAHVARERNQSHLLNGFWRMRQAWRVILQVCRPSFAVAVGFDALSAPTSAQRRFANILAQLRWTPVVLVSIHEGAPPVMGFVPCR